MTKHIHVATLKQTMILCNNIFNKTWYFQPLLDLNSTLPNIFYFSKFFHISHYSEFQVIHVFPLFNHFLLISFYFWLIFTNCNHFQHLILFQFLFKLSNLISVFFPAFDIHVSPLFSIGFWLLATIFQTVLSTFSIVCVNLSPLQFCMYMYIMTLYPFVLFLPHITPQILIFWEKVFYVKVQNCGPHWMVV